MESRKSLIFTPLFISGCLILLISFAIRATFGLFQIPISEHFGWLRTEYSLAIAIQNLSWGIGQPIFCAIAEKFGDRKAIAIGAITYAVGLVLSKYVVSPESHQFLGFLIGFGIAGTGFGVILAVVGRTSTPNNRSLALGIATSAGSAGQIIGPPIANKLLENMYWGDVFLILAVSILIILILTPLINTDITEDKKTLEENLADVLKKAISDPSYIMLFLGFFSCGFQLAFITAHFPAFVTEMCSAIPQSSILRSMGVSSVSSLGAFSIAVIGITNLIGTILAGALGNNYSKKNLLSLIYVGRTVASSVFILNPITPDTVVMFSAIMGALWLATVPLTSGIVAQIYGLKYMGTLYGLIFLSHQIGSFVGVWLGGLFYDLYGSYDVVWWVGIGVGLFSAIIHLPIKESPIEIRLKNIS